MSMMEKKMETTICSMNAEYPNEGFHGFPKN